jgi:hypothetical protein
MGANLKRLQTECVGLHCANNWGQSFSHEEGYKACTRLQGFGLAHGFDISPREVPVGDDTRFEPLCSTLRRYMGPVVAGSLMPGSRPFGRNLRLVFLHFTFDRSANGAFFILFEFIRPREANFSGKSTCA